MAISNTPRPAYVYDTATSEWIPIGVGAHSHGEIPATIVDAKGDLIAASAADTPARLAVGNNGETLVADSSATTGLRYNPQNALANPVINGGMDIWQRGTSISFAASTGAYAADRWFVQTQTNQASTIARQATGDTTNLPNIQYCVRVQRNSGQTGTGNLLLSQSLESTNAIPFAGKTVTISFYARAGANFAGTLTAYLIAGTGTDQNRGTGNTYTGETYPVNATVTLTTNWQRFAFTGNIGSTVTEFAPYMNWACSGTAGAADYYEITGFQIDLGTYTASTAPAFRRSGGTIAGELAACQRYYVKSYPQGTAVPTNNSDGVQRIIAGSYSPAAGDIYSTINFPVVMRTAPSVTVYSYTDSLTGRISNNQGTTLAANSAVVLQVTDRQGGIYNNSGGSLSPQNGGFLYHYAASSEL